MDREAALEARNLELGASHAELEAHVARANRVAAAAAKHAVANTTHLTGRLESLEELVARLDRNLQSTKLVLRLREEALGKARKGGGEDGGEDGGAQAQEEIKQLRKMAECPPEVIRMGMEMQQLRRKLSTLEAENGVHPAKGKMHALETELRELRTVRVEEGEFAAQALEDRVAADEARSQTDARNKVLEAQRDVADLAAADAGEAAALAEAAGTVAAAGQAAAEVAQTMPGRDAARVQATFDEQKAVMEEMFGQIESLDALRCQLEAQLADATATGDEARTLLAETEAALAALAAAKVEIEEEQQHGNTMDQQFEEFLAKVNPAPCTLHSKP
jgi:hypothetical protein